MQNLESIDWSTCVKFYVGAHFSTLFYTLSTIINVFTQPGHEADEFAGLKVRCERTAEIDFVVTNDVLTMRSHLRVDFHLII